MSQGFTQDIGEDDLPQPITLDELMDADTASAPRERFLDPAIRDGRNIEFDRKRLTLRLPIYKSNWLEVDLESCRTKKQLLEVIKGCKKKVWFTPEIERDFFDAIEDAFDTVRVVAQGKRRGL